VLLAATDSNGAYGAVYVDGVDVIASVGSNVRFSLDGITFRAEPFVDKHRVTIEVLGQ
jgi:hypothetical protein